MELAAEAAAVPVVVPLAGAAHTADAAPADGAADAADADAGAAGAADADAAGVGMSATSSGECKGGELGGREGNGWQHH